MSRMAAGYIAQGYMVLSPCGHYPVYAAESKRVWICLNGSGFFVLLLRSIFLDT